MFADFCYPAFTIERVFNNPLNYHSDIVFRSITTSSLSAQPGSLFVPLVAKRDGHDFIVDALEHGASGFLCQKEHPVLATLGPEQQKLAIPVNNTLYALGKLAKFHRQRFRPIVIAITGSSGKTTTKQLFQSCLSYFPPEQLVITEKNFNNEIGTPFTLFRIGRQTRIVICELGMNHRGEISRLSQMVQPDFSLITGIGTAHIEFLGSRKEIARAKAEIVDGMAQYSNLFFPFSTSEKTILIKQAKRKRVLCQQFSIEKSKHLQILATKPQGFQLKIGQKTLDWPLPGRVILQNLAGVLAICQKIKLDFSQLVTGLKTFQVPANRFEILHGRYHLINDCYNANPESMQVSLQAAQQLANGQPLYAILADMKELGKFSHKLHREVGNSQICQQLSGLFTFGEQAQWIADSYSQSTNKPGYSFMDKQELATTIHKIVPAGSYILIKGSRSMHLEELFPLLQS